MSILHLHKRVMKERLKMISFHKDEYKTIFSHHVTLSDTVFTLLIKADVVNNTLNKN